MPTRCTPWQPLQRGPAYEWSRTGPLPWDAAQDVAYVFVLRCDDVAAGVLSWPHAQLEDTGDGAAPADAREMNGYLRAIYCPALD